MFWKKKVDVASFERDLTQLVVLSLMREKIIAEPNMRFLKDADALRDAYHQEFVREEVKASVGKDREQYVRVLAYHAFGAGAYVSIQELKSKNVADLASRDAAQILNDMRIQGSLELGLKAIYVAANSRDKQRIDNVILSSMNGISKTYRNALVDNLEDPLLFAMMKVFFNMGTTVAFAAIDAAIARGK